MYTLRVSAPYFAALAIEHFEVAAGDELALTASLAVGEALTGVLVVTDPTHDIETKGGKTTFRGRSLTDLPLGPPEEK